MQAVLGAARGGTAPLQPLWQLLPTAWQQWLFTLEPSGGFSEEYLHVLQ